MARFPWGISSDQEMAPLYDWLQIGHNPDGSLRGAVGETTDVNRIATFAREGPLLATAGVGRFLFPNEATISAVVAAVNSAPEGASVICDVNKNGVTIFTTQSRRPVIAAGAYQTAAQAVPNVTSVVAGDYLSVDIDQVGSTFEGADLVVQVVYTFV